MQLSHDVHPPHGKAKTTMSHLAQFTFPTLILSRGWHYGNTLCYHHILSQIAICIFHFTKCMLIMILYLFCSLFLFYRFISVLMQGRHCQGNIWKVNSFPDHEKSGNFMFVQDLKSENLKIKGSFNKYIFFCSGWIGERCAWVENVEWEFTFSRDSPADLFSQWGSS